MEESNRSAELSDLDLSIEGFETKGLGLGQTTPERNKYSGDPVEEAFADLSLDGFFGQGLHKVDTPPRIVELDDTVEEV